MKHYAIWEIVGRKDGICAFNGYKFLTDEEGIILYEKLTEGDWDHMFPCSQKMTVLDDFYLSFVGVMDEEQLMLALL